MISGGDLRKGLEGTLNDKKKKYIDKVNSLLSAWEHLSVFIPQSSPEASENLFSYVHKYTLQLLLHGDWPKLNQAVKTHLGVILHRCIGLLSKINADVTNKCRSLINLVHDPWKHPTLHKILHNLPTTEEEVNIFFEEEGSQLLVMRLEVLCESKCEDLALSLAESCFRYLRHSNVSQSSHVTYIRDVLLALLFRFKRNHDIIAQLKLLNLHEGLNLVQRYAKRSNDGARVWRNCDKVAEIAAHAILASAMVQCVEDPDKQQLLYDLIKEWALIHIPKRSIASQTIQNMIRKMIQTAESSLHIYIFCKVLINEFPDDLKSLCIELYIKGLTANMNEIEQQKMKNDKKKIYDCEIRLSDGFLQLADLLNSNIIVCRECVLTAFSLNPTRTCLERIKALAISCQKSDNIESEFRGFEVLSDTGYDSHVTKDKPHKMDVKHNQDTKLPSLIDNSSQGAKKQNLCSLHSNVDPLDIGSLKDLCSDCGALVKDSSVSSNYENSSTYNNLSILDPETLGLAPHLCDDLSTVLSCPRYHTLHWSMDWKELSSKCEKYLEEYDSRRNATTELKYLNIDYSQFKDWPEDVQDDLSCGIEKGYEQWIDYDDVTENTNDRPAAFNSPIRSENKEISSANLISFEEKTNKNKRQTNNSLNCDFTLKEKIEPPNKKNIKFLSINNEDDGHSVGNTMGSFNLKSDFERIKGMKKKSYEKSVLRLQRMKKKEPQSYELKDKNQSITNCVESLFNKIDTSKSLIKDNVSKKPISSILKVNRPVSDPNVLKTLRMYRFPDNKKLSNNVPSVKPGDMAPSNIPYIDITGIKVKDGASMTNLNPKVVLTRAEVNCSHKKAENIQNEKMAKFGFHNTDLISEKGSKLDILAQAVMSSDILLANSVPGLNSLDMIIPETHEPTVQVFQLPTSATNTVVSQNCSVSSSTDTSTNNSFLNRSKPHSDTQTTDLVTSHSNNTVSTSPHSSSLFSNNTSQTSVAYLPNSEISNVTLEHRNAVSTNSMPLTSIVLSTRVPKQCKQQGSINQTSNSQAQSSSSLRQLPITSATPLLCTTNQILNSNQVINTIISSSEGSTQVSNRTSRTDYPAKQTKLVECNSQSVKLCTSASTQSKPSEETLKTVNQLQPNSIFRLIVKDGTTTTEEHYARNFLAETGINSTENDTSKQTHTVKLGQEQIIRLIKRRKEIKTKPEKSASLPKFDHVFGRQVYQAGTDESSETRSEFMDAGNEKEVILATPCLSKGVQTALKDKDSPDKKSERLKPEINHMVQENGGSGNTAVRLSSNSKVNCEAKAVSDLQSPPGVIFTCKVPVTISNTNLLPRNSVTIIKANSPQELIMQSSSKFDTDSQSKESVIRSNMNALLAAALQSPSPLRPSASQSDILTNNSTNETPLNSSPQLGSEKSLENVSESTKHRMQSPTAKTIRRQPLVQQRLQRFTRPLLQVSAGSSGSQASNAVVSCIPLPLRTVQVLTANLNPGTVPNAKLETRKEQVPLSPVEQTSVSSTTLEQLREFESVLEQVTNTSQMKEKSNTSKANTEEQVQHSHNTDSEFSSASAKQNTIFSSSLDNTISDSSNERSNSVFINKSTGNNSTNAVRNTSPSKITATPVVVVQSSGRSVVSPALSITPPSSSSPAHTGVGNSNQTKINTKINKPKSKPVGKTTPTANAVKVSTLPKPQQKPQEDEQTTQRIYAILDKYAEQLRNSPELKNKPAPRRRSNPSSNSSQSSKRKKSSQNKTKATSSLSKCSGVELSPGSEDVLTVGSEDSSNGLSQISQVMSSPQSHLDELSTPTGDVSSETSESLDSKEHRLQHRTLLTESGKGSARAVVVQENVQESVNVVDTSKVFDGKQVVGNSGTVPLTLSLPGAGNLKQVIFPMPADGRQFVVAKMPKMYRVHQVSGSPLLATTGSGAVVLRQMCINKAGTNIKQVKVPVVTSISPQNVISKQPTVVLPSGTQTFTLATNSCSESSESLGIAFDNTVLLNTSTAGSSISFVQRNLSKPLLPTSSLVATTSLSPIQDTSVSRPSSTSDMTATGLKSDNASVSTTCVPSKTDSDIEKSDKHSKDKFVINSSSGSGLAPRTNSNKSWSQVLTDVMNRRNGEKIVKEVSDDKKSIKIIPSTAVLKPDSTSQKGASEIWRFTDSRIEVLGNGRKSFSPPLHDIDAKSSEVETCFQYNTTRIIPNAQCLRQKSCNGENTIFQIAFRKVDKNKSALKEDNLQQKSAASIERERFQKSLSDECEDLGVDKPSTSDLFPEAELLLDSDPLSRDSLPGELLSRGLESSSSSHDSPSRSPILATRFKSCHWKKQKRSLLRHQVGGVEKLVRETNSSYSGRKSNLYDIKPKTSRCSTPINKDIEQSNFDIQEAGNEMESCSSDRASSLVSKCIEKNDNFPDDLESHGNSRDSESDCNNSEEDDDDDNDDDDDDCECCDDEENCKEPNRRNENSESALVLMDCGSKSLNDSCNSEESSSLVKESGESPKLEDTLLKPVLNTQKLASPCVNYKSNQYKFTNFISKDNDKNKSESELSWYKMMRGVDFNKDNKPTLLEEVQQEHDGSDKASGSTDIEEESSSDFTSPNGMHLETQSSKHANAIPLHDLMDLESTSGRKRQANSPQKGCKTIKSRKRKKISAFVLSNGEDSVSSIDTVLLDSESCQEIHRTTRRASSRGLIKKGCPCLNGSPEPAKKKKELGLCSKTDKHISPSSSLTVLMNSRKPVNKCSFKTISKKR